MTSLDLGCKRIPLAAVSSTEHSGTKGPMRDHRQGPGEKRVWIT